MFDVPSGLSIDEVKQVFRCLGEVPSMRLQARHLRFFNPANLTTNQAQIPRERIAPGPPLGRSVAQTFTPGAQSLLVTYATNAKDFAGQLFPLNKPEVTIGRRGTEDLCIPEATVSGSHAIARWQAGSWILSDRGSTNGTYADHSYERKKTLALLHGGEVQLGECRVKLVSFEENTPQHERARRYLAQRDGLTGLWKRDQMLVHLEEELRFAQWYGVSVCLAVYEVKSANRMVSERPTILEMLALRRAAQRVIELTEVLLLSMVPVTAGRIAPLRFVLAMTGTSIGEARNVMEQVLSQVQGLMPESLELGAKIIPSRADTTAAELLETC